MFGKKKKDYIKGKYPYWYQCPSCKDTQPMDELQDQDYREKYAVKSDLPIFFECIYCPGALMMPIGYVGKPSFVVTNELEPAEDFIDVHFHGFFE